MNQPTPAIVSQAAVRRLPRLALLLFCIAYVLPGFIGREPWKVADVAAFGAMHELALGNSSWWSPVVLGLPVEDAGALPYWLGALCIRLLPFLPADWAARLPFIGLLALTLALTWYTVYHLARQPGAQPVAFAFGGEANPTDYARAMADAGLLALMACLGLAQLSHEATPDLVRLACMAAMLLGVARLAHTNDPHPLRALLPWSLGCLGLVLSGSPWLAFFMGLGCLLWLVLHPASVWRRLTLGALLAWLASLLVGLATEPWPDLLPSMVWTQEDWDSWGRLLVWFTWPAWPLALWTLWRWRRQWMEPHVALPAWAAVVGMVASTLADDRDRALLVSLPALATLAAFALPTLRRSVAALIDWFTLLFFSGCALVIWVIWVAMMTGVPAKPAANVAKLAPGFQAEFGLLAFVIALAATLAWLWLVSWRVGAHRQALWKSLVLPAAGAILCWLLLMTLWLPLLDFGRSYGPISRRIASLVPPSTSCVVVDGLTQAQISALRYHGKLTLLRSTDTKSTLENCRALVVSPDTQGTLDQRIDLTQWAFRATVRRLTDNKESLLLYQRVSR